MNLYYDLQNRKYEKLQAASEAVSQSRPCLTLPTPQDAAFFWGSPMLLPPFLAALRIHEALRPSAFGVQSGPRLSEDVSRFLAFLFSRHASSPTLHRCLDTKCLGPCMPLERLGVCGCVGLFKSLLSFAFHVRGGELCFEVAMSAWWRTKRPGPKRPEEAWTSFSRNGQELSKQVAKAFV